MRVFHTLEEFGATGTGASVAIGNFDGVHLGHASLLKGLGAYAATSQTIATVLTFFPHPVEVLHPGTKLQRLSTAGEKLNLLESLGIDVVGVLPFDQAVACIPPRQFFDRYLVEGLRTRSIHVGFNFTFGHQRSGNTDLLGEYCREAGIDLHIEPPFEINGRRVSSSLIRGFLLEGDIRTANSLLGRPYFLTGQVKKGDRRGRDLGFPTANVRLPGDKLLPKNGVYVTRTTWQKQAFASVANVGVRPTFGGDSEPRVEVHLLDFYTRLYDEWVTVEFVSRLRDERKFDSQAALITQIQADVAAVRIS